MEEVYQGQTIQLAVEFEDATGTPVDPIDPRGKLLDSLGATVIPEQALLRVTQGVYYFPWSVPGSQAPGFYYMVYSATIDGEDVSGTEVVKVLPSTVAPSDPSGASEYCNVSCVQETILRIKKNNDPDLTNDVLKSFIQRASAQINGRLRKYYKVPLTEVPEIITEIACNLASVLVLRRWYISNTPEESQAAKNINDEMNELLNGFTDPEPSYFLDGKHFRDDVGIGTDGKMVFFTTSKNSIYVGNLGYNATFDFGRTAEQQVDPQYIDDLRALKSDY